MRRYDDPRDWDRGRDRDRGVRGQDNASVLAWIPSTGIEYEVIYEDLSVYMGAGSSVEPGNHPKVG
jgi:hypothetical protein